MLVPPWKRCWNTWKCCKKLRIQYISWSRSQPPVSAILECYKNHWRPAWWQVFLWNSLTYIDTVLFANIHHCMESAHHTTTNKVYHPPVIIINRKDLGFYLIENTNKEHLYLDLFDLTLLYIKTSANCIWHYHHPNWMQGPLIILHPFIVIVLQEDASFWCNFTFTRIRLDQNVISSFVPSFHCHVLTKFICDANEDYLVSGKIP